MPLKNKSLQQVIKKLQARHAGTDAMALSASAIRIWEQLTSKFMPMIGPGSVRLIYSRSLELNKSAFPWLPAASAPDMDESPFAALKVGLEGLQPDEAVAANCALLDTFIHLLATLIGAHLTIQFLRSAFPDDAPPENPQESQH